MKYRVFWSPHAEERLEHLLQPDDEQAILAAAARDIDRIVAVHPLEFGESRYETVRLGYSRPLAVQYEVLEDVDTVIVYDVWRIDRKRGV